MENDTTKPSVIVDYSQYRIIRLMLSMPPAKRKLFVEAAGKIAGVVHCKGIPPAAEEINEGGDA